MSTATATATNNGTAKAGKAGEAPKGAAANNGAGRAGEAHEPLTSAGVASLLKSEFAGSRPGGQPAGETEVQPGAGEGQTPNNNGEGAETPEQKEERERQEAHAALEERAQEAGRTAEEQETFEQEETALAARAEEAGRTVEEQREAEVADAAAAAEGATEVPAALEAAITEWEENGRGELPPALQGLVDRRINKVTARAKAAEDRVTELEAQLAAQPNGNGAPAADDVPDSKTFNERVSKAKTFANEVEAYLEDVATDEEKGRVEKYMESQRLDAKGLKRNLLSIQHWLAQDMPNERQLVQDADKRRQSHATVEKTASATAERIFPWLKDKNAPQHRDFQEVLNAIPDLAKRTPVHKLVAGVYVLGLQQARKLYPDVFKVAVAVATNGKPKPGKAPPKTPAAGGNAPPKPKTGASAEEDNAREQFTQRPTREGVTQLLKIGLRK